MTEAERLQAILDRVASHSRTVRLVVEQATAWVDSDGQQGKRHGES